MSGSGSGGTSGRSVEDRLQALLDKLKSDAGHDKRVQGDDGEVALNVYA